MFIDHVRQLAVFAQAAESGKAETSNPDATPGLSEALRAAEEEFSLALVGAGPDGVNVSSGGRQVLAWARSFVREYEELHRDLRASRQEGAIAPLLQRRSVSPKRLQSPGPGAEDIELMLLAALRAPDHGGLHPWRVLEFRAEHRPALAAIFEQEKRRRDPLASSTDLRLAREHATRAPVLLAFVVSPRIRNRVPMREQWLAAGAALGNLMNAAHQLGFGAIVLSGERCFDALLAAQLGIRTGEFLAGFISVGTIAEAAPPKAHAIPGEVWSSWVPRANAQADAGAAGPAPTPARRED